MSLAAFADSYWDVAPLLRRAAQRASEDFSDLLTLDGVDELIARRGLRTPFVRMSKNGDVLPSGRFTRGGGAGAEIPDQVADDKMLAEFAAGATIVLQGLHRVWSPIADFAGALCAELGHPIQVNAYLTPPQSTGFAPHYDVHDVFVVQFAGRKRWRIHEPVLHAPLRDQPWTDRVAAVATRANETPLLDRVLETGDVLYLPRGYVHAASSLGEISGHLTVGVHCLTRRTLVDQIFATLGDERDLRRSLPPGIDVSDAAALDREIDATLDAMRAALARVDRAALARGMSRHLAATTRPAPVRPLRQLDAATTLTAAQRVRLRPGLRVTTRLDGDGRLAIVLPDRDVHVDGARAAAAHLAISGADVRAEALPDTSVPDGLELLADLLRAGVVVPV